MSFLDLRKQNKVKLALFLILCYFSCILGNFYNFVANALIKWKEIET